MCEQQSDSLLCVLAHEDKDSENALEEACKRQVTTIFFK